MKTYLWGGTREKDPETKKWDKLVSITQVAFRYGYIPETMTWTKILLIKKGGGGYRGIGLVEVIWKFCAWILNSRLLISIVLYDKYHGFRQGRGTETAFTEGKI